MSSGGSRKEKWNHIFIQAPMAEAKVVFYNRFGHNPERVTCTCCGEDYSISEESSLMQLTGYERGCDYQNGKYVEKPKGTNKSVMTLKEYAKQENVLFIYKKDIKPDERVGEIPSQGYVWVG